MATNYTTVAHSETVSINVTRGASATCGPFTYTAPTGQKWAGPAYATYASSGTYAGNPAQNGADYVHVKDNGDAGTVYVSVFAPAGYVSNSPLAINVNLIAIDA